MITFTDSSRVLTWPEGWNDLVGYLHYNWNIVPAGRGLERNFFVFQQLLLCLGIYSPSGLTPSVVFSLPSRLWGSSDKNISSSPSCE